MIKHYSTANSPWLRTFDPCRRADDQRRCPCLVCRWNHRRGANSREDREGSHSRASSLSKMATQVAQSRVGLLKVPEVPILPQTSSFAEVPTTKTLDSKPTRKNPCACPFMYKPARTRSSSNPFSRRMECGLAVTPKAALWRYTVGVAIGNHPNYLVEALPTPGDSLCSHTR